MPKLRLTALMMIAIALLAVGCGGSSDGGGTSGGGETSSSSDSSGGDETSSTEVAATVPKAVFIKEADAICSKARKQTETEFAAYLKEEGIKEIGEAGESAAETKAREAEVIETLGIPALSRQQKEIREIGLPEGEEELAETYLAEAEKGIETGEANPSLLYNSSQKVFAKSDKLAGELGFKVCGNR